MTDNTTNETVQNDASGATSQEEVETELTPEQRAQRKADRQAAKEQRTAQREQTQQDRAAARDERRATRDADRANRVQDGGDETTEETPA